MTMPAEVTTEYTWDRLIATLRAQFLDIDDLYQHITDRDADTIDDPEITEEPVPDSTIDPYPDSDAEAAQLEEERRERLDFETDGELDGDYDPDPDLDPS